MEEEKKQQKVPPRSEWKKLTLPQLYEARGNLQEIYYSARRSMASYADQYAKLLASLDVVIREKELEAGQAGNFHVVA
jgi:hypothetical protein